MNASCKMQLSGLAVWTLPSAQTELVPAVQTKNLTAKKIYSPGKVRIKFPIQVLWTGPVLGPGGDRDWIPGFHRPRLAPGPSTVQRRHDSAFNKKHHRTKIHFLEYARFLNQAGSTQRKKVDNTTAVPHGARRKKLPPNKQGPDGRKCLTQKYRSGPKSHMGWPCAICGRFGYAKTMRT